jgi:hypothetical protein
VADDRDEPAGQSPVLDVAPVVALDALEALPVEADILRGGVEAQGLAGGGAHRPP